METDPGTADAVPKPRAHRWGLGAFVIVELAYLGVSASLGIAVARNGPAPAWMLALAVAVPTVTAAALAVVIARIRGNGARADFRLRWSWRAVGLGLAFGTGGLFVTMPAAVLYQSIVGQDANSAVGEVFSGVHATWPAALLVFVIVVFLAPICEEIVYRGLLWGALEQRWGRWIALSVSTVVFALAHLEPARAPLLLIVAIPIALARLFSESLVASTVAHQVTNLLPGVVILLGLMGMMPAG
ncbi:integral membrane protein [Mycolicibacterium mageritense DSM 44476 = CIP 104973]|uniref:Integral membrane protein n=1 Tax=Mycolicibacterium mageritense TaxID=53462 RepID=A0AAI8U0L8_MYCME|nr:type II CAAX endopeptidase family protein [Mycolicibacterium mageritense]MBN3454579.1 CPBP family intramembrane metalloprotease [Mycobacterium sp. DSM 3803]MCC9185396.1 CPBP family intramembrane metalloprotease [Mycolicibacterium mageritense]TXI65102.1 MAG: CPBP family intramembrane metalloprotease [Mycolicibacterium mageritense]CDO26107.1 integral membrane protein [Mycolicibacterium mageritense DSM 44476 = CIP 104973]BBX37223.1 integral membrane protein [Mycolicibacterium mageritense]